MTFTIITTAIAFAEITSLAQILLVSLPSRS